MEGQVIAICDEISQVCHDLDDSVRSKIVDFQEICKYIEKATPNQIHKILLANSKKAEKNGKSEKFYMPIFRKDLTNFLITDLLTNSRKNIVKKINNSKEKIKYTDFKTKIRTIKFSLGVEKIFDELQKNFLYPRVYNSREMSYRNERAGHFIRSLFETFMKNPLVLHNETLEKMTKINILKTLMKKHKINNVRELRAKGHIKSFKKNISKLRNNEIFIKIICDHIAGMTDTYAQKEYERFYEPFVAYMES